MELLLINWRFKVSDTKVGSIYYDLDLDDKSFKSKVKGASSDIGGLNKVFKSAEQSSQQFATGLLAVGSGAVALAGFGIKSASEMENLRMSLDVMTGSAEKGEKIFKDLYDFAAKTPFETKDLAKATTTMLGFGIQTNKVMPYLKMLGDVSMGDANKLGSLTLAFSQISSTGKLMGQDLLQLINGGFNPLTIISQKTGKSMTDLKDDMSKGLITFDMVADAFKTATDKGGLFYQGMDKGSKTLSGTFSTLQDSFGMLVRNMVGLSATGEVIKGSFFDKLRIAIQGLSDYISNNIPKIMKNFEDFFNLIKENLPIIIGLIVGGLTPALVGMVIKFATFITSIGPFMIIGALVAFGIQQLIKHCGGLNQTLEFLKTKVDIVVNAFNTYLKPTLDVIWDIIINNVIPAIGQFYDRLGGLDGIIQIVKNTVNGLILVFDTYFKPALMALWEALETKLFPALMKLWNAISPVLIPALKLLGLVLLGGVVVAFNVVIAVLTMTIQFFSGVIDKIASVLSVIGGIAKFIINAMIGVADALTKPFKEAFDWISNGVNKVVGKMANLSPWTRHSPSLIDQVTSGMKVIKSQYSSLADIQMPSITKPEYAYAGINGNSNINPSGNQNVKIYIDKVRDYQDVQAIGRELGFRAGLTPS